LFEVKPAVWIVVGLVLAALEMFVPGMVIIWFGIAAVVTGILAFFVHNPYVEFGIFIGLSALLLLLSQRIARRITRPEPEPVGANRFEGVVGRVIADIVPPETGRVKVLGEEWRAEAGEKVIRGAEVKVIRVEGTRLIVEPIERKEQR